MAWDDAITDYITPYTAAFGNEVIRRLKALVGGPSLYYLRMNSAGTDVEFVPGTVSPTAFLPDCIKFTPAQANFDVPISMGGNGPDLGYQKMTNGITNLYLEWQYSGGAQQAFFEGVFDKDWDEDNLTAIIRWYSTSASTDQVKWKLYGIRYTSAATRDIAVNTLLATITQSNSGALYQNVTTETAAFTLAGTGRNFVLMLTRDYATESPSLAAGARFLSLEIYNMRVLV